VLRVQRCNDLSVIARWHGADQIAEARRQIPAKRQPRGLGSERDRLFERLGSHHGFMRVVAAKVNRGRGIRSVPGYPDCVTQENRVE
jgi:hypothetical protein